MRLLTGCVYMSVSQSVSYTFQLSHDGWSFNLVFLLDIELAFGEVEEAQVSRVRVSLLVHT